MKAGKFRFLFNLSGGRRFVAAVGNCGPVVPPASPRSRRSAAIHRRSLLENRRRPQGWYGRAPGRLATTILAAAFVLSSALHAKEDKERAWKNPPPGYNFDPTTLKPLTAGGLYRGKYEMGLYPGGVNEMPEAHRKAGERLAATIRPLDTNGRPNDASGRILVVSLGHSNADYYFGALEEDLKKRASDLHPRFEFINCAVAGTGLGENEKGKDNWDPDSPDARGWNKLRQLKHRSGYSLQQVQVLFVLQTFHHAKYKELPPLSFPKDPQEIQPRMTKMLEDTKKMCPNLKIACLVSEHMRHFSGVEPHIYEEAFAVKWLIEKQIKGEPAMSYEGNGSKMPWLCWGPYLWDGAWDESYFLDGTHAAPKARAIFVEKFWKQLSQDSVARPWFLRM